MDLNASRCGFKNGFKCESAWVEKCGQTLRPETTLERTTELFEKFLCDWKLGNIETRSTCVRCFLRTFLTFQDALPMIRRSRKTPCDKSKSSNYILFCVFFQKTRIIKSWYYDIHMSSFVSVRALWAICNNDNLNLTKAYKLSANNIRSFCGIATINFAITLWILPTY